MNNKNLNLFAAIGFLVALALTAYSEISVILISTKYLPLSQVLMLGGGTLLFTYIFGIAGYVFSAIGLFKKSNLLLLIGIASLAVKCFFNLNNVNTIFVLLSFAAFLVLIIIKSYSSNTELKEMLKKIWFLPAVFYLVSAVISTINNSKINIISLLSVLALIFSLCFGGLWVAFYTNESKNNQE